ncbi:MAG TPA: hypothetical protein VHV29_21080 [Terriglobales bacterium]|nr:hypothetical protein [Terriglobales bacterium]
MWSWLVKQWHDIEGHAKWALLGIIWLGITTYGPKLLHMIPSVPSWLPTLIFVCLSALVFVWLAKTRSPVPAQPAPTSDLPPTQQPTSTFPTISSLTGQPPQITFDPKQFFRTSYFSPVTAEVEHNIQLIARKAEPNNLEAFYARFIGVGLVAAMHDAVWSVIFKSQLLMLTEMNRRRVLPLRDAHQFYTKAVAACPKVYPAYTFDQWLNYLKSQQMLVHHPTDMLEISHKGKDFLKYLAHWGRDASMKVC